MSELTIFQFEEGRVVRTLERDGELWFVAKDVAEALGYTWHRGLINHVPEEWKGVNPIDSPGGVQNMQCLSEQGLYFFLGRSDKDASLPFQKWIAGDVVPSIRKKGYYAVPQVREMIEEALATFGIRPGHLDIVARQRTELKQMTRETVRLNAEHAKVIEQIRLRAEVHESIPAKHPRGPIKYDVNIPNRDVCRGTASALQADRQGVGEICPSGVQNLHGKSRKRVRLRLLHRRQLPLYLLYRN